MDDGDPLWAAIRARISPTAETANGVAASDRAVCARLKQELCQFSRDNNGQLSDASIRQACDRVSEGSRPEHQIQVLFSQWLGIPIDELVALRPNRRKRAHSIFSPEEDALSTTRDRGATVYASWGEAIQELLPAATDKVIFIDTWFDEGSAFAPLIQKWHEQHPGRTLKFEMHQLSEESPFGGQRLKEIEIRKKPSPDNLALREMYRHNFYAGLQQAQLCIENEGANLILYKYDVMPGTRLLVIDDDTYVFSWFPLGTLSATNVCFAISSRSAEHQSKRAIECLKRQLDAIVASRELIGSTEPQRGQSGRRARP